MHAHQSTPTPLGPSSRQADIEARPLLFNSFMTRDANENPIYNATPGYDQLKRLLDERLAEYNESNAVMDLVGGAGRQKGREAAVGVGSTGVVCMAVQACEALGSWQWPK